MSQPPIYIDKTFRDYQKEQITTLFSNKRYLFHLLIWIISAIIFFITNPDNAEPIRLDNGITLLSENFSLALRLLSTVIGMVISAFFIYMFLLLVIPYSKYKAQKRYILLSIFLQGAIFFFIILGIIIWKRLNINFNADLFLQSWLSIIYIEFFFISLYFFLDIFDKQKTIKKYSRLLEQRIIAETKFLNSQINPHFLFNTINNIYALTIKDKEKAILGIEKLEYLIEYIHNKSQSEYIRLDDEVTFLKSYIDLELLRYQKTQPDVQIDINGSLDSVYIAPLILITFIENAFKHGVRNNKTNPFIHISIEAFSDKIIFEIINGINPDHNIETDHNLDKKIGGIGIQNTLRRLELLYPDAHRIRFNKRNNSYSVELTLMIQDV